MSRLSDPHTSICNRKAFDRVLVSRKSIGFRHVFYWIKAVVVLLNLYRRCHPSSFVDKILILLDSCYAWRHNLFVCFSSFSHKFCVLVLLYCGFIKEKKIYFLQLNFFHHSNSMHVDEHLISQECIEMWTLVIGTRCQYKSLT